MHSEKYNIDFEIERNIVRLTNQLWKLIPMRENEEDWVKQLRIVRLEIVGLNEVFNQDSFLELISKLEGLEKMETNFEEYRSTVFKCISLLKGVK